MMSRSAQVSSLAAEAICSIMLLASQLASFELHSSLRSSLFSAFQAFFEHLDYQRKFQ
jgi:hypothetical protein